MGTEVMEVPGRPDLRLDFDMTPLGPGVEPWPYHSFRAYPAGEDRCGDCWAPEAHANHVEAA